MSEYPSFAGNLLWNGVFQNPLYDCDCDKLSGKFRTWLCPEQNLGIQSEKHKGRQFCTEILYRLRFFPVNQYGLYVFMGRSVESLEVSSTDFYTLRYGSL